MAFAVLRKLSGRLNSGRRQPRGGAGNPVARSLGDAGTRPYPRFLQPDTPPGQYRPPLIILATTSSDAEPDASGGADVLCDQRREDDYGRPHPATDADCANAAERVVGEVDRRRFEGAEDRKTRARQACRSSRHVDDPAPCVSNIHGRYPPGVKQTAVNRFRPRPRARAPWMVSRRSA